MIKLIAGLGNPGSKYERNRHNLGFRAVDRLLDLSPAVRTRHAGGAMLFETRRFGLLCKPLTYMNRSGGPLRVLSADLGLLPQEILILFDDFALDLGLIRIRSKGSSGGHNGLQSVIDKLGTVNIPRVRLGIKTGERDDWVDFVLNDFRKAEEPAVADMLELCCDAVEIILESGITTAMNRFNKKQKPVHS